MSLEDEIQTLPSLRDRAKAAIEAADAVKAEANADIYQRLREEAYAFFINELEVDQGTASMAVESATEGTKAASKGSGEPGQPDENLALRVTVDKLVFRCHFVRTKIFGGSQSSEKKEFKGEDVFEDEFRCDWQPPSGNSYQVSDLATLGRLMREHMR